MNKSAAPKVMGHGRQSGVADLGTVPGHPFSLYIHIPYCDSKCPYCDFNSYAVKRWPEDRYRDALVTELEWYAEQPPWRNGTLQTVFFGGGTPSLFSAESIAGLLASVCRLWPTPLDRLPIADDTCCEITLEANPGTVTLEKLRGFVSAGINRLSFGVQSLHPQHLARLGRIHSAAEAIRAIEMAHEAAVPNLNLDLIFAIPAQTLAEWEDDLRAAVALAPDHISAYNLTFEEGTAFEAKRRAGALKPLPEETELAMFTHADEILEAAGYAHYEISNYALPARECRHNLNYWHAGQYLGVGAGAHSFAQTPDFGRRWSNEKVPDRYLALVQSAGHARAFDEAISEEQARGEFVFLGLRCRTGFDGSAFAHRFGVEFPTAFPHVASLQRDGLIEQADQYWHLTDRGLLVADSVFATFV